MINFINLTAVVEEGGHKNKKLKEKEISINVDDISYILQDDHFTAIGLKSTRSINGNFVAVKESRSEIFSLLEMVRLNDKPTY